MYRYRYVEEPEPKTEWIKSEDLIDEVVWLTGESEEAVEEALEELGYSVYHGKYDWYELQNEVFKYFKEKNQ